MPQVLQDRLLPTVAELALPIVLVVVNLLLRGQSLLELHLLLHLLLLVREDGMLARRSALIVVNRVTADGIHLALLRRVLIRLGVHHHLLALLGLLHQKLLLRRVHQMVGRAADAGPQARRRVVLRANFRNGHALVLGVLEAGVLHVRTVETVLVECCDLINVQLLLPRGRG